MKKRSWFAALCALVLSTLSVHAAEGGSPSDIRTTILDRLVSLLEGIAAVLPEFLQGFFQALIAFLQVLLGG